MKPQQRKFVVEIKSRRRSSEQPKSIWGNTDFKALTLKVEEDAPHLFGQVEVPEPVADQDQLRDGSPFDLDNLRELAPVAPATTAPSGSIDGTCNLADPKEQVTEVAASSARDAVEKTVPSKRLKSSNGNRDKSSNLILAGASQDELTALMAENLRLKRLLYLKISRENLWLREKLAKMPGAASRQIK